MADFTVVAPIALTPTYSSANETEIPLWDVEECYARGEEVRTADNKTWVAMFDKVEDRLNKCKTLYNIGKDPATAEIPSATSCMYPYDGYRWWKEISNTRNASLMFDGTLERETVATGTLEVHFVPATKIDALCIFGITASKVRVESERYSREDDLEYPEPRYPSVKYHDQFIELDFPHEVGDTIKLFFEGVGVNLLHPVGTIRVGIVVAGVKELFGLASYGTEVGIKDYSQKDRDTFGMPIIREETYSEWVRYDFEAETDRLYQIKQLISKYRAQYVAYIGEASRPETCVYGMMQDFSVPVESYPLSHGTLEVLGAPVAFHRPYCPVCPDQGGPWPWRNVEGKTIFCDGLPLCDDEAPVPEGEYGLCQTKTIELVCGDLPNILTGRAVDSFGNIVDVGLNGALFINNKRTPFSPWYSMNWRDLTVGGENTFVAVGERGLIASFKSEPPYSIDRRLSPFNSDYHSVLYFWHNGIPMFAAATACGQFACSEDGERWFAADEFDDFSGCLLDTLDTQGLAKLASIKITERNSAILAVLKTGVVLYGDYSWEDITESLILQNAHSGAIGRYYEQEYVAVANDTTLAMAHPATPSWRTVEIAGIASLFSLSGDVYVCTRQNAVYHCQPTFYGSSIDLTEVDPPQVGTLAPLTIHAIASGQLTNRVPMG